MESLTRKIIMRGDVIRQIRSHTQIIDALHILRKSILNVHKDLKISKTVGSSISITGSVAIIGGVIAMPFTGGVSLGLSIGGLVGGILGAGTSIGTGLVETVQTKKWSSELKEKLDEHQKETAEIREKISNHPDWIDITLKARQCVDYVVKSVDTVIDIAEVIQFFVIMAPYYGKEEIGKLGAAVSKQIIAQSSEMVLEKVGSKGGLSLLGLGMKVTNAINIGVAVAGIGYDIYTIVDIWTTTPGSVQQIDAIISQLEEMKSSLIKLRDKLYE